ncbi:MAG: condensation domain-containing protein, partial [Opitutales bacterium]|nr:condensation domain-containing protein [Opitutales bacterium]
MSTPSKSQDLKERLAGLSEEQRLSLLAKMRDRSSGGEKPDHGIEKADPISVEKRQNPHGETVEVKIYEASNTEESMLFLIDYFAGEPVYTSPMAFHLTGQLNPDLLEESLNVLVARHGVLRTLFEYAESGVVQCEFSKVHLDLTRKAFDGPLEESRTKAEAYAKKHAKKCFDSSREFPISAHYLTIGSEESVVIIVLSHIVSDGWSRSNFCREFCDVYAQLESGKAVKAEANALQMPDYSHWQKSAFKRSNNSDHLNYWKERFEEKHTLLELPADYPRTKEVTCNGDCIEIELGDELVESLKTVARENGATLYMLGLAAFKTLLLGYSGQQDIVVGTPTANRSRPEFESMIGCFINTLAIRSKADSSLSFFQYLDQVRANCVEAYHHESVPYSEVASELNVERSGGSSPNFKTIFALQDFPELTLRFNGMECTDWGVRTQTAKVEVYLNLEKLNGDWVSIIEYNTDLFTRESMERFSRNWKNLLERIASNPDQPLAELASLSEPVKQVESEMLPQSSFTSEPSASQKTTSCYVIGSGRVIVDSVEILRAAGIDVRGLISKDASVLEWAKKENLNCSNRPDELETFLSKDPFDYLFSINNPKVLGENIFSIPVKGSINFHDAPLPRYGGVNAMYWAIINKETSWAVTW